MPTSEKESAMLIDKIKGKARLNFRLLAFDEKLWYLDVREHNDVGIPQTETAGYKKFLLHHGQPERYIIVLFI